MTVNGRGYTVFEYAPGGNYKTFLEHGRLTADQMLTVGIDLASALFTAHRKGIIHRDIKPSNILINAHNMPMLADFGIAGTVYGRPGVGFTIAWAAPEVLAQGGGGNESSDIYSLGIVAYEGLCGHRPFTGATPVDIAAAHVNNPVPPLPDTVDVQLREFVMSMLAKDPLDRPRTRWWCHAPCPASNAVCSTSRRSWPTRWSSLREEGFPDVWSANPISP